MLGLRIAIYKVADIQQAKLWYSKAFEIDPYFDQPYYVGFNIGGYELALQPEESSATTKTDSAVAYWGVEAIQETYDRLMELGATEHEKPRNIGGELMVATVNDPFGNVIGLVYNPDFKLRR